MKGLGRGFESLIPTELIDDEFDPTAVEDKKESKLKELNNIAVSGLKPDLTIVFDIDAKTSMLRVGNEKDRMESSGMEFFERVRNGYLEISKQEPERVKVIDSTKSIEDIHKKVLELVKNVIG